MDPTLDQLIAQYVKGWSGFRVDGKGFLVPNVTRAKLVEEHRLSTRAAAFETKAYDPKSKLFLAGVANAHEVDRMREVVTPQGGDFMPFGKNPILLWMHQHYCPIGQVPVLKSESHGVLFEGWCGDPAAGPLTQIQNDTRSLIAQKILKAVSIGFIPLKIKYPTYNERGEMVDPAVIEEWEMLELSVVSVPCNAGALFEAKALPEKASKEAARLELAAWTERRSFPILQADGRLEGNPKEKKVDEETKKLLEKLSGSMDSMASGIGKLVDGQSALQKSIDGLGAAKAKPPKEDPKDDEEDDDEDMKALKAEQAKLVARIELLEKTSTSTFEIVKMLAEKQGVKAA